MGSKTRLSSYCTKRANNGVNLVTSWNINTRLARPINIKSSNGMSQRQHKELLTPAKNIIINFLMSKTSSERLSGKRVRLSCNH